MLSVRWSTEEFAELVTGMSPRKSRKSFLIRIDPKLYDQLAGWAAQEFRSINGQIEFILREAVARRGGNSSNVDDSPGDSDSQDSA